MNRYFSARTRTGGARLWTAFVLLALVLTYIPIAAQTPRVEAHHTNIKWPFAGGSTWYISQGYNTSPSEGWSHYNCDPQTLKDAVSQTRSCNQYYQYKYSFDVKKLDGNTAGQQVLSPVNGTIRWIDEAFGGMSIDLGDGYAVAFFHSTLAGGLAAGQQVLQGQVLGTVAPAGEGGNGGTPHIHLTIWQTTDGGNWSRNAVPFTGDHDVDGYDLPALSESTRNQHYQKQIVSTNSVVGAGTGSPPAVPTPTSPAMGTTYQSTGVTPTLTWNAVSGATGYQVVVNDGSMTSPWVTTTSWKMPALTTTGQYAWQVKARNAAGESALSAKWVFWVDPANGGSQTPTPTSSATGTPGPLKLTLDRASAGFGADVLATGSGYNPNETINIYLDSISTTAIATTTASGNGSFSKSFTMPEMTGGNHTIIARGVTSKKQPTAPLKMSSTLARTPYQGPPGTSIAVTVYGFGASETVKLNFDSESGPLLGNATTNAKGTGTVNIKMPNSTNGWHDYVGVGQTSNLKAYGALYVERIVSLSPTSGNPGTTVNLTAKGFPAQESITVGWNRTATIAGTTVCSGTTTATGNFTCSFTVPQVVAGGYPVMATSSSGANAGATFGVLGPAAITINPTSGAVATNITVSGGGFQADEQVRLTWDSSSTAWFTIQADANGSFLRPATVPNIAIAGHTLNAKGMTSNKTASFAFRITSTGGNTGSSMIAPGTYRVTATIEGLVGHGTSNGHTITPFDHFVALPACTQSSCDWLTPGGSTYVAPCGNNCYVKVLNEATGLCSVAPVWDRGPWFINDNWWETPDKRYLNTRSGAINYLAQGYVGADAARNGLDVGFGVSSGIGVSDVGYQTGNRAAIDIADGTWVDIGLPQSAGIGTVVVTMLWQTGQSHTAAEAACGQSTPTPTPTTKLAVTLSPKIGPVGTKVTVNGTGYGAGETVKVYLDSSSTTALASVKASSSGSFTAQITIPSTSNGDHRIHAVGQTTKLRTAATFTVGSASTPTPTATVTAKPSVAISPSKGPAGTSVQVTGKNYGKSETVKIYLDTTSSPALASVMTSNAGEFSAQITIPDTVGGNHRIHAVGQTSKLRTARTYQITPTILASKTSGFARETIVFQVKGFGPNETVSLYWDGSSTAEATATTDANGVAGFNGKAPWLNGAHTGVIRGSTSNLEGNVTFTVRAKIKLTPTSGDGTTKINARGTGFAPATTVNIFWGSSSSGNLLCSVRTSSTYGTFNCEVAPKAGSAAGSYSIIAIGGGKSATATFTLTSAVVAQADEPTPQPTATEESTPTETTATPTPTVESVEPTAEATAESTEAPAAEPTEQPTEVPSTDLAEIPTEVPTAEPTLEPTPEPVTREIVLTPVADTSVSVVAPDQPQSPESVGALTAGGENGDVTFLTFNVEGIAAGNVVNATLVLTGSGEIGAAGGIVRVASGYVVDEASLTHQAAPTTDLPPAVRADGSPTTIDWIDPGAEVRLDVTGTVTADGTVTFVIAGIAEQSLMIGSRESGVPPRLVITVVEAAPVS